MNLFERFRSSEEVILNSSWAKLESFFFFFFLISVNLHACFPAKVWLKSDRAADQMGEGSI